MMDISGGTTSKLEMSRNVYDTQGFNALTTKAKQGDPEAIKEAAKQFEAIFVQMLLKSMRKAQEALADKDSPFNSDQVKYYRDMHDQQMAVDLSAGGNLGLAEVIIQQMTLNGDHMPASALRTDGNLSSLNQPQVSARLNGEQALFGNLSNSNAHNNAHNNGALSNQPSKRSAFESPRAFIESLYPYAQAAAEKLNIDPKALLAQAALETGWGKKIIHQQDGDSSHNLFGIKADRRWQGEKAVVDTIEYVNNVPEKQRASFRSYQDFSSSLNDYVNFIQSNPRYQQAIKQTESVDQYFNELQQAGYATDPAYAEKVMSVYNGELLNDLLP